MFVSKIAIFIALGLLITIPLSFLLARIAKIIQRNSYENEIEVLFNLYWNRLPEDELYAWYKVRYVLLQRDEKKKKLRFVNRKISEFDKQRLYGNMTVSEKGELIDDGINV